jgi:asparagine synthase (glutamine-hydrolysing)
LAKGHVKVLLSGEGGDEAFAGYPNYPNMLTLSKINACLGPLARPTGIIAGIAGQLVNHYRFQRYAAALGQPLSAHYFSRRSFPATYFNRNLNRLLSVDYLNQCGQANPASFMADLLQSQGTLPLLDQMLYADTKTWLPDDLLIKADKITMANSLELRVPLLDHKVLEFAASLPARFKVQGRQTKRALKTAFTSTLPAEIIERKKVGFPVPYSGWLQTTLAGRVRETLLSDRAQSRNIFNMREIEKLLLQNLHSGRHSAEIFTLLAVELWHQTFLDQN